MDRAMHRDSAMKTALFAFLLLLSAACSPPYYLKNHAAGALDCPEDDIKVRTAVAPSRYHQAVYTATGCGRSVQYMCAGDNCTAL